MFESLWIWLVDLINQVWYVWLFFASFIENLIPPIPSEVIMPLGGYLAWTGKLSLFRVIVICTIGSTLWCVPYYLLGRCFSKSRIKRFVTLYGKYFFTKSEYVDDLYDMFEKNDRRLIFFGRFLPWARSFISIPAGSCKMNFWQFFWYTLAGTAIWTVFLVFLWFWFGNQYSLVVNWLEEYKHIMYPLIIVAIIILLAWVIFRKKSNKE